MRQAGNSPRASFADTMTATVSGETTPAPTTLQTRYGREYPSDISRARLLSTEFQQIKKPDRLAKMRHCYTSRLISKYIPWYSRVLDIGIGGGRYWSELRGKYDVVGVDLNSGRFVDYVLNIEEENLEKIGEKFDFVTMFDVIEHLENPVKALTNIGNVMGKNGLFLGSTPNRFDPYLFVGGGQFTLTTIMFSINTQFLIY